MNSIAMTIQKIITKIIAIQYISEETPNHNPKWKLMLDYTKEK